MSRVHVLLGVEPTSDSWQRTVDLVLARAEEWGLRASPPRGLQGVYDQVLTTSPCPPERVEQVLTGLSEIPGVEAVHHGMEPLFRIVNPGQTAAELHLDDARFGGGYSSIIAGPCSVESAEALIPFAAQLRNSGATCFRAGAYKPRTSPYHFPGLGPEGLETLAEIRRETGLPIVTELLRESNADEVASVADMIQIGSRNMSNHALLRAAAQTGRAVLLKRGMAASISDFLQSAEALAAAGAREILLCERGLRHFDQETRNLLDLASVPLLRSRTHLPILVDPSHGVGRADLVPTMMLAAAAAGADGLLVEVHPQPSQSVSDAAQALSLEEFSTTVETASKVFAAVGQRLAQPSTAFSTPLDSQSDA